MTSSIYPRIPSLTATTITTPGSGYTTTPTVTIDPPPSGRTATGTANIANGVINAITDGFPSGAAFDDGEEITLTSDLAGTGATGIAVISGGVVQSIVFTSRGSGFVGGDTETVTITGVTSAQTTTFTVNTIANNAVSSITLTDGGLGYTSAPNITITGGNGSGAAAVGVFAIRTTPIPLDSNILTSDIAITSDLVNPGGGGILRLYFTFVFNATPGAIAVTNNGAVKGTLNADNSSEVLSNGYYRFDIDVESGDNINLQLKSTATSVTIDTINFVRAHLVQFGA